ncbi:MAG TPA: hypothetical protein VFF69_11225 [Phycisphaerales bacterium]|nr:hypothetical protein [Phycisphaerales bacterium]
MLRNLLIATACCAAVIAGGCTAAPARPPRRPAPQERGDRELRVSREGDRVRIVDGAGRALYDQRELGLSSARNNREAVVPAVEVVARPDGMDLVYTYTNDRSHERPLADMRVGALLMPDSLIMQDANMRGGEDVRISHDERPTIAYTYPSNIYSPVYVLRDDELAVGVSVMYPLMEYRHDVQFRLASAKPGLVRGEARGWVLDLRMSTQEGDTTGKGWVSYPAAIAPGESRVYTVAVRFTERPTEWVRTLLPYREYFRARYGGVQYDRRDGPILGYPTGSAQHITPRNPYGFRSEKLRPDVHGFGPIVEHMLSPKGWPEVMVVKPTGQYFKNQGWNYPFLFASPLESTTQFRTAFDRRTGLASLPSRGKELALWWGRALQVATEWDPETCETLDPGNPDHRARARRELEAAARLGATTIGLDAFSHTILPVWESYAWLSDLRREFPQFHFIVEPMACDVLHTLAPTWLRGWDEDRDHLRSPEDVYRFSGPHRLADFLLPGHECILAMRYQALRTQFGIPETQERVDADAARFASWGFRPEIFTTLDLSRNVRAARSWLSTVPADLQIPEREWREGAERPRAEASAGW